jgi:sulfur transfer complex TusBCD TusB component (DsrH family)
MIVQLSHGFSLVVSLGILGILGAFEDGQAFIAGVLAKITDPDARAQAKAVFDHAAAKDAVTLIGDGVLARADYSKHMDAINKQDQELKAKLAETSTLYDRNSTWYQTNKAALEEYPTLKAELERLKTSGGGDDDDKDKDKGKPPVTVDKKTIEDTIREMMDPLLSERERGYVDVVAFMQDTGFKHQQLFGAPLVMRELIANPKIGKPVLGQPGRVYSLQDAYDEKYGADVAKKAKEEHDKQIDTEVEKRLAERMKGTNMPFPLRGAAPSVLDVLDTKEGPAAHTLDTAVAAYESLQAGKGLSG